MFNSAHNPNNCGRSGSSKGFSSVESAVNRECESGKVCTSVQMLRNGSFYNARIKGEKQAEAASSENYR